MDTDSEDLVALLQSDDTSAHQDMDEEVMGLIPSENEHGFVGPICGPHLPGLEAGNSIQTAPHNSPVPSSFMAYEEPGSTISTDIKDQSALPGQSGLQNMGNTCFMNSGLQCLMHNSYLCHSLLGNVSFPPDSLTGRFIELLTKVWEGQYAVLHPSEFKEKLGSVHGQFKDFRQHDGQEFLALVLDSLHEELNWNARQRKVASPATDLSEESDDSHYASEASSSKLSELEALELDSVKDEPVNNRSSATHVNDGESCTSGVDNLQVNSTDAAKDPVRLPSIEEFYMKDVKTLNTNMLQENEVSVPLATGSDKFPKKKQTKADRLNLRGRTENSFQKSPVKNKKTNVIAARKSRLHSCLNNASREIAANSTECSSSTDEQENIKRMKMDPVEGGVIPDKPSNVVSANFHDYVMTGSGDDPSGFDRDSDQLGLETLSRKLKQELDSDPSQSCDSSSSNLSKAFPDKNTDYISKLDDIPSSTTCAKIIKPSCTLKDPTVNLVEVEQKNREFIPNNKEHLSSLQLEKPSTSIEKNQEGEKQWEDYLRNNESVIVDNFHGQLKSTVICKVCGHVSIMYEPFMYLSVPLPRAMEKQFVVTFVRSGGQTPVRYAVVLNKTDTVKELRRTLLYAFYGEISGRELVLAEALDCHISRVLEDGIQLQYVNSSFRLLYAFEIDYKPCITIQTSDLTDASSSISFSQAAYAGSDPCTISSSSDFAALSGTQYDGAGFGFTNEWDMLGSEVTTTTEEKLKLSSESKIVDIVENEADSTVNIDGNRDDVFSNMQPFKMDSLEQIPDLADSSQVTSDFFSNVHVFDGKSNGTEIWAEGAAAAAESVGLSGDTSLGQETDEGTTSMDAKEESLNTPQTSDNDGATVSGFEACASGDDDLRTEVGEQVQLRDVKDDCGDWHICVICLEELSADQLLTHIPCQGKLCHHCVSRTKKHYGEQLISCPVCRADMNPGTDFVPLIPSISNQPFLRVLLLPVQFRNEWVENGERKMMLFGHPNVLYVMNKVSGEDLFSQLENIAPVAAEFSIALTDGQGIHCSRCSYDLQCSGCLLAREVDITLSSDDHLTVCFYDQTLQAMEEANRSLDDESMDHLLSNDPISLQDCFRAFTASEELDECNPWYCPECKKPQKAVKTMAIQKFPNTLIVYLKRFVFHQFMSTKLDNKVNFPIMDLNFSEFMSPECSLVYDLQSAVCHFGGVNAGHYTSYVKNPITGTWQYCNDESIIEREPSQDDAESVYILFYQRKDTALPFKLPQTVKAVAAEPSSPACKEVEQSPNSMDDQSQYSNSEDISKLLASLDQEDSSSPHRRGQPGIREHVEVKETLSIQMDDEMEARLRELD